MKVKGENRVQCEPPCLHQFCFSSNAVTHLGEQSEWSPCPTPPTQGQERLIDGLTIVHHCPNAE